MSIRIIKPGFLSTLQDLGRNGFQSEGVPVCGAMDRDALSYANLLAGNEENCCCIEFTLHGAEIEFEEDLLIAITGGGSRGLISDSEIPFGKPVHVRKGSVLKLTRSPHGCRSYLATGGGFQVERIMNSSSTYLPSAFGGLNGKALQAGDKLETNSRSLFIEKIVSSLNLTSHNFSVASWGLPQSKTDPQRAVRVFEAPEWSWITEPSKEKFYKALCSVQPSSNRMGIRLQREKIERRNSNELLSTSVSRGTIQCTPDGNLILLMSDCQTTGGYPRVAQVAAVDLSSCAQLRVGDQLQFTRISFDEAEQLFLERQRTIQEIKRGIRTRFNL